LRKVVVKQKIFFEIPLRTIAKWQLNERTALSSKIYSDGNMAGQKAKEYRQQAALLRGLALLIENLV